MSSWQNGGVRNDHAYLSARRIETSSKISAVELVLAGPCYDL